MKIEHVVVAGPNGALGAAVISNLLKANFTVTILTRNPSLTEKTYPTAQIAETDYSSVQTLTHTLKSLNQRINAIICLLNRGPEALSAQKNLIDATASLGQHRNRVVHFIPSSFGADMRLPMNRDCPPLKPKGEMEEYVKLRASEGRLTYTIINQGVLLDWCLDRNILLNFDGQPIRLFDGGKAKISATVLDDLGKAVVGALRKDGEVKNKYCFVHSRLTSQLEMLRFLRELKPGENIETVNIDTDELVREAEENLEKGDTSPAAMRGFIAKVSFGEGGNWFERTDNEVLGVEEWSEGSLKELIARYI